MAEEVAIELGIGGAKSLIDLKKEFKELQTELSKTKEGTKEYQQVLQKLGAVKDDIGDLRDTISALNPEGKVAAFGKVASGLAGGFQAATGAAALFGTESKELEKVMLRVQAATALQQGIQSVAGLTDGFKVLGTVIRSNPLFLIATVLAGIGTALYALKDKIGFVGEAFKVVGNVIEWVTDKITEFTDWVGISNSELTKQGKALTDSITKSTEALNQQTQAYDDQIRVAKAAGKSTIELEKAKQQAIIDTNKALVEQTIEYVRNGGKLDEERAKLLTKQLTDIKKANVEIQVIEATHQKELQDKYKDHLKKLEQNAKDLAEAQKKAEREMDAYRRQLWSDWEKENKAISDRLRQSKFDDAQHEKALEGEVTDTFLKLNKQKQDTSKETSDKQKKHAEEVEAARLETAQKGLQAAQALTDLYFSHQLRQAKGNADKEREIRKKQFNVNKAFGIANAVVDGFGAVQKALNNPYPLNIVLAVISGVLAAANVAKIASQKFDDGGGSSASAGDIGSMSTAAAPVIPQPNNTVTKISDTGKVEKVETKPEAQRVYVVETDIKRSNDRVANIEETAKIG